MAEKYARLYEFYLKREVVLFADFVTSLFSLFSPSCDRMSVGVCRGVWKSVSQMGQSSGRPSSTPSRAASYGKLYSVSMNMFKTEMESMSKRHTCMRLYMDFNLKVY